MSFNEPYTYITLTIAVNERSEILKWLNLFSSLPFSERHQNYRRVASKASGTGAWIFTSKEFIGWKQGLLTRLWCHGIRQYSSKSTEGILLTNI